MISRKSSKTPKTLDTSRLQTLNILESCSLFDPSKSRVEITSRQQQWSRLLIPFVKSNYKIKRTKNERTSEFDVQQHGWKERFAQNIHQKYCFSRSKTFVEKVETMIFGTKIFLWKSQWKMKIPKFRFFSIFFRKFQFSLTFHRQILLILLSRTIFSTFSTNFFDLVNVHFLMDFFSI